jgi:hypothetical protein
MARPQDADEGKDLEGIWEYTEYVVANSRQRVVLQLRVWDSELVVVKSSLLLNVIQSLGLGRLLWNDKSNRNGARII